MDNLFEQMVNISKAHGYDILSKRCKQLETGLLEIERKITHPDIDAIRDKAIHSEFDELLKEIRKVIVKALTPEI